MTYGSFVTDATGELTFRAENSVGMAIFVCPPQETPTATSTATSTPTDAPIPTDASIPTATAIATATSSPLVPGAGTFTPTDLEVIEEPVLELSEQIWLPLIRG